MRGPGFYWVTLRNLPPNLCLISPPQSLGIRPLGGNNTCGASIVFQALCYGALQKVLVGQARGSSHHFTGEEIEAWGGRVMGPTWHS